MNWEQVLINAGLTAGFLAFLIFWVGLALWLRVDADKRGMLGWAWAFVGIVGGPFAFLVYLLWRGNRPVLAVVKERDALLEEAARTGQPSDYNPIPPAHPTDPAIPITPSGLSREVQAALEAEQRLYRG